MNTRLCRQWILHHIFSDMKSREKIDDVAQNSKKVVTWGGKELQSQEKTGDVI